MLEIYKKNLNLKNLKSNLIFLKKFLMFFMFFIFFSNQTQQPRTQTHHKNTNPVTQELNPDH